jgi:hypothetical protein
VQYSAVSASFLRAERFFFLLFWRSNPPRKWNPPPPHCVQEYLMSELCSRVSSRTHPSLQSAGRARVPPAVISCVSWFVFSSLTALRGEKQKVFACRRGADVPHASLVPHIVMATARDASLLSSLKGKFHPTTGHEGPEGE